VAVEKLPFPEIRLELGDQKCIPGPEKIVYRASWRDDFSARFLRASFSTATVAVEKLRPNQSFQRSQVFSLFGLLFLLGS
jgi:hypothetical protein